MNRLIFVVLAAIFSCVVLAVIFSWDQRQRPFPEYDGEAPFQDKEYSAEGWY